MTTTPLDILLIETHPGIGAPASAALESAGHRLHRCHDRADRGFGCRGLHQPSTCPLEGHVDVAFLVRDGSSPRPSAFEDGVRCAIRADVPLVEAGPTALDPYTPWVAERVEPGSDVSAACQRAADKGFDDLTDLIRGRLAALLAVVGIAPAEVRYQLASLAATLEVKVVLPIEVSRQTRASMAVRVLDAVRVAGRTFGRVDVSVTTGRARE